MNAKRIMIALLRVMGSFSLLAFDLRGCAVPVG